MSYVEGWSWSQRRHYLDPERPAAYDKDRYQSALCGANVYIPSRVQRHGFSWELESLEKLPSMPLCKRCEKSARKRADRLNRGQR